MHEFVFYLYSNPMELQTLDPNLYLSSQDTPFCLITCLFASSCASHVFMPQFGIFCELIFQHAFFLFVSLLVYWLVSFVFACTRMEHGHLEQGCDLLGASKKGKDASLQRVMFSRQGAQALHSGPFFLPLSKPLLQSMYQGSPSPCNLYFSYSLLGPCSLGMAISVLHFLYLVEPYPQNIGNV